MNTFLFFLVSVLPLSATQMTFSDGWEKRSPHRPYDHHYKLHRVTRSGGHAIHEEAVVEATGADEKTQEDHSGKSASMIPITNCMEEYMNEFRKLHVAMMDLYTRFQTCENSRPNPLMPANNQKTSRTRF